MQSLQDFWLHIVDAADIAHHLKFANFNEPIPFEIAQLFKNPMHYVTIILSGIIISYFVYKLFQKYLLQKLKTTKRYGGKWQGKSRGKASQGKG